MSHAACRSKLTISCHDDQSEVLAEVLAKLADLIVAEY
jgi:hypothetical protein